MRHPSELAEPKKITISVRIRPDVRDALEQAAKRYGITASHIISSVLEDYVAALKDGKDTPKKS